MCSGLWQHRHRPRNALPSGRLPHVAAGSPPKSSGWPVLWGAGCFLVPESGFLPPTRKRPILLANDPH